MRLLAAAGAFVALLAVLGLAGLGLSRAPGGPVLGSLEEAQQALGIGKGEVPKVVGLTEEEARGRLGEEGFGVSVKHRQSAQQDEGKVLEQSVPVGKEVQRGSRIALAVGSGPRTVKIPNLVGLTPAKAEEKLQEADLGLGDINKDPSEGMPAGEGFTQDPAAGKKAEVGTEVGLTVSSGPPKHGEPDRVDVPDVSRLGVNAGGTGDPPTGGGTPSGDFARQPFPSSASASAPPSSPPYPGSGGSAGEDQYQ